MNITLSKQSMLVRTQKAQANLKAIKELCYSDFPGQLAKTQGKLELRPVTLVKVLRKPNDITQKVLNQVGQGF